MLVHSKIGSSKRLKEMFERVNKLKLNEDFESIEKDEEEDVTPEDITGDDVEKEEPSDDVPADDNPTIEPEDFEGDVESKMDDLPPEETGIEVGNELEGGVGDDAEPSDFDPEQVGLGIKVEMEHTNDPKIALEIALDHLTEIPDYYTRLDNMEDEAKEELANGGEKEKEIIFGKDDWIDSYKPVGVGECCPEGENYPHPIADPEAGEQEWEEAEKAKSGEFEENPEEKKNLEESNGSDTYFDTLHGVINHMEEYAQKLGLELDKEAIWQNFGTGGISYGETKSANIPLLQNGQPILDKRGNPANRAIHVSVYRMDSGRYELTMYKTW